MKAIKSDFLNSYQIRVRVVYINAFYFYFHDEAKRVQEWKIAIKKELSAFMKNETNFDSHPYGVIVSDHHLHSLSQTKSIRFSLKRNMHPLLIVKYIKLKINVNLS